MDSQRIDKWLWAARFYKTRSIAVDEITLNRVRINERDAKPSSDVKIGSKIELRRQGLTTTVIVKGLSAQRGPASQAQQLYEETPESLDLKQRHLEQRPYVTEPARSIEQGRPTKRDRRALDRHAPGAWDDRWRASLD